MAQAVSFFKHVIVAPFEQDIDAVIASTAAYPARKIILLAPPSAAPHLAEAQKTVSARRIPVETAHLSADADFDAVFDALNKIRQENAGESLLIDLGSAGKSLLAACLSYAHLYGIDAIHTRQGRTIEYPIPGVAFFEFVKGKKLDILAQVAKKDCCDSMEDVSRKVGLSASLVSYHLYGTAKNPGLIELALVEPVRNKNRVVLRLTLLGKLVAKQYAQSA
jgi:DNA-binding transcriptional ArsR family regulator